MPPTGVKLLKKVKFFLNVCSSIEVLYGYLIPILCALQITPLLRDTLGSDYQSLGDITLSNVTDTDIITLNGTDGVAVTFTVKVLATSPDNSTVGLQGAADVALHTRSITLLQQAYLWFGGTTISYKQLSFFFFLGGYRRVAY